MAFTVLDNFKRNEEPLKGLANQWTLLEWAVNTGRTQTAPGWVAKKESAKNSGAYYNPEEFTEPKIKFQFEGENETGGIFIWACLTLGTESTREGYRFRLKDVPGTPEFKMHIEKVVGTTITTLAESAAQTVTGHEQFEAEVRGKKLKFFKNGVLILEVEDASFTKGYIAIEGDTGPGARFGTVNFEAEGVKTKEEKTTLTASQAQASTLSREVIRTLKVSQAQSPVATKQVGRSLSTTQAQSTSVTAIILASGTLTATQAQTATLSREIARTLTVSQNQSPAVTHSNVHPLALTTTQPQATVLVRTVGRTLIVMQAQAPSLNEETTHGGAVNALAMIL